VRNAACGTSRRRTCAAWWAIRTGGWRGLRATTSARACRTSPMPSPAALKKTTEWPIVGLACVETTYFAGTRGRPYLFSGADTQSLSGDEAGPRPAVCLQARDRRDARRLRLPSRPRACAFARRRRPSGDHRHRRGFNLFDLDRWQALDPTSIVATEYQGAYLFDWNNGVDVGQLHARCGHRKAGIGDADGLGFLPRLDHRPAVRGKRNRDQRALLVGDEAHGAVEDADRRAGRLPVVRLAAGAKRVREQRHGHREHLRRRHA
jgi:hypothetical protein